MRIALGFKARTGRAILVAVGINNDELKLVARDEFKLLPKGVFAPYHAAEGLKPKDAQTSVENSIAAAHRLAQHGIRDAVEKIASAGHQVLGCGVLVGAGMPKWTTGEILAVHVRMHQAEGELFRNVLVEGARELKLQVTQLPHKSPLDAAVKSLGVTRTRLDELIAALGKQAGSPWGQHQKEAAVAAIVALRPAISGAKTSQTVI
jgi:hypothetical protein